MSELDIDALIADLVKVRSDVPGTNVDVPEENIVKLIEIVQRILLAQPVLLDLSPPVKIVGDIHGQYYDLLRIFEYCGFPPETNYLFLGDYVDRGKQSIECVLLLFCYKAKYPENVFLLRGNHECSAINHIYGFYQECVKRYSSQLWMKFNEVFNYLPFAATIDSRIFCCHGGLSPDLNSLAAIGRQARPTEVLDAGLLCDLLWSDPATQQNGWRENDRGVSYTFGADIVEDFLQKNDLDLICRAHQVVEDGYEFFAKRKLTTIFSAPNYCGEFNNCAAVLSVDTTLMCSLQVLRPQIQRTRRGFG